ncbi:MAG: aminotransferase class I/II-fold pyridoxal phosphate-dependent enzyme [Acidimicrobiales bacterium]|nr:aminotransferase class I/II-fold pyridoxal phosphate-dependent enzyme [Acidimicrobiales bacterium]
MTRQPFVPPVYPYDRLNDAKAAADALPGGIVDLSIGTPCDPPPQVVLDALATSNTERGYPQSVGSPALRDAVAGWMDRRLGVSIATNAIAACVGTKEFVGTLPQWLALRDPSRDTVLYPELAYPTSEMGATLAGCRAVAVPVNADFTLRLDAITDDDANRALCLWVNTPGNPAGQLDDLGAAAAWGRERKVPVFSDECYVEFTWDGPTHPPGHIAPASGRRKRTILHHGTEGVVAVHSLSKRSNLAGLRVGFYAGDADLVHYLSEVRKHVGMMVPGPAQAAGVAALRDDAHVDEQAARYRHRLERMAQILKAVDLDARMPQGGFYLWAEAPDGQAWALVDRLARDGGCLITPGDTFGAAGQRYVRIAVVQPDDRIELVAQRLGV